ncbi:MAG: hypothetical protein KBT87_04645 [Gammaproteobacteria bacterium]|jgi:hypothetical protein|nr:hypothetical protein [Gammaproteobacteria bacterium]MBQ0773941.1 hypothetical protein [Gammaproteobacteria bacterium]|tara:strand:- start:76993 stop:77187 length:195 start_codon:yes stop_codon:yes gene_type:complete
MKVVGPEVVMNKHEKGPAKSAVMQPKYRLRVERDKTRYDQRDRQDMKKALKKGLYSFWRSIFSD